MSEKINQLAVSFKQHWMYELTGRIKVGRCRGRTWRSHLFKADSEIKMCVCAFHTVILKDDSRVVSYSVVVKYHGAFVFLS